MEIWSILAPEAHDSDGVGAESLKSTSTTLENRPQAFILDGFMFRSLSDGRSAG